MKPSVVIIGAGGHGKVVYDALIVQNKYEVVGFVDSILQVNTNVIADAKVICTQQNIESLIGKVVYIIVAIGNNEARAKVYSSLKTLFKPAIVIHPSSVIGTEVNIGEGSVILANAVVNARASIGENTIINSAVVLDHDCRIGNHAYLKLGTIVANNMVVKDFYTSEIAETIKAFSK